MNKQYVYAFENAYGLGKELLGGKGAGLAEMTHIGVPIPQGFTITTEACSLYYNSNKNLTDDLVKEVKNAIKDIEKKTSKTFGGDKNPLLVSVRSGARVSMPGMMDTILNLGLNDKTVDVLAKETNNERFAYDSYRRFILMFTNIAKGHPRDDMDKMLDNLKKSKGYKLDTEVIHNITYYPPKKKVLKLISATRLSSEKGGDRIKKLASMFKKANIPFMWFIFSAEPFTSDIDELIYMKVTLNIQDYIRDCDYLVQLSDSEGFCYSIIEALEMGVPVITTPLPVLKELGVRDGIDGYFVPFDLNEIDLNKIYNEIPIVDYKYDNQECINKWITILGKPNPVGDYVYHEEDNLIKVQITNDYYDTYLQKNMSAREVAYMPTDRAIYISNSGYCKILD